MTKDIIAIIYKKLQARELHPKGTFDKAGRFYLEDSELVDVREPSRAHPFSQMTAGRTKKFVKAIAEKYNCETLESLENKFRQNISTYHN